MSDKLRFAAIRDYPIFEVGKWNNMEFKDADLEEIAQNFNEYKATHQVPLKLGHNDEQPITDGQPALGWVESVRKHGKQLLASFEKVPQIVADAISKGMYRTVSIELLCGMTKGSKKLNYLLDAVAILGADRPAVSTLPDLSRYLAKRSLAYDEGGRRVAFESDAGKRTFTSNPRKGGPEMDDDNKETKGYERALKFQEDQIKSLEASVLELKTKFSAKADECIALQTKVSRLEAQDAARETESKATKVQHARAAVTAVFEDAVKARVITPAQRDADMLFAEVSNDEKVIKLAANIDTLKARYKSDAKKGEDKKRFTDEDTTRSGSDDELPEGRTHKDVFSEVNHRVNEFRSKNRVSFSEALKSVLRADLALAKEYANTSPPVHASAGGK